MGDAGFLIWVLLLAIPLGLILAGYWARGLGKRTAQPKVPPGDPGNPT